MPAIANVDEWTFTFEAGGHLTLQNNNGTCTIVINDSGITITGLGGVTVTGSTISLAGAVNSGALTVGGDLHVNGNITCTGTNPNNHSHP